MTSCTRDKSAQEPVTAYFLGSGELGIPVLRSLVDAARIRLVGVGTQPDRPAGRKRRMKATPLGEYAVKLGMQPDKPASVNAPSFLDRIRTLAPELVVVVAFGQLLKEILLNLPASGCFNVHASLLPRHRGAAPINQAILVGDAKTGVSFMKMDRGLDTGPVYEQIKTEIGETETADQLETRLADLAGAHIVKCIWRVCRGDLRGHPQPETGVTYAPKLKKQDGAIEWTSEAQHIERKIRALSPWPRAHCRVTIREKEKRLQLTHATVVDAFSTPPAQPGTVLRADENGLVIACGVGALKVEHLIPEGRSEMSATDFLRGSPLAVSSVMT